MLELNGFFVCESRIRRTYQISFQKICIVTREKDKGMKIYFCGSICGGRQDAELYTRLIEQLKGYGTVLTEHVGTKGSTEEQKKWTDKNIHDNSLDWLTSCDVVVAEVTQPSLGVGYEIGRAVAMNKKILCIFRPSSDKRLSAMISGADNGSTVQVKSYTEPEAAKIFKDFFI